MFIWSKSGHGEVDGRVVRGHYQRSDPVSHGDTIHFLVAAHHLVAQPQVFEPAIGLAMDDDGAIAGDVEFPGTEHEFYLHGPVFEIHGGEFTGEFETGLGKLAGGWLVLRHFVRDGDAMANFDFIQGPGFAVAQNDLAILWNQKLPVHGRVFER